MGMAAMRALLLSCLVAAGMKAVAAGCPGADSEALAWLDKMSRSLNQVSYHGVVTLQRGGDMQVMQISHAVHGDSTRERLTQLTGQGAQVVRTEHPLSCIHPGHRLLQVNADLQAGRCGIAEYYRFSVGDGERVAGRKAVRVRVDPRDMYRYGYVMELDRETGLLLKTETIGRGNRSLEKFQFANLAFGEQFPETSEVNLVHEAQHPLPAGPSPDALAAGAWGVHWVPLGFTVTDAPRGSLPRRTYTDGLAVFSVFLEQLDREIRSGEGVVRSGSTVSYARGMQLDGRPVLVTVIGEVPINTARMVADSVRWTR
jgi:sigma-E factor negative regulatory protein RseB